MLGDDRYLEAYTPAELRARGVYYTPAPLVRAQVRLAAHLLERTLGCRGGFADKRVLIVDPAAGSGAYPLAVVADVVDRVGHVPVNLGSRMRLHEPMRGAASLAWTRIAAALGSGLGLQIEHRDTLARPVALRAPIVVCLGNPPYNRQVVPRGQAADRKGGWVRFGRTPDQRGILADFSTQADGAGLHLKSLYNDYVYFWRWALWAVFEQRRGPGIVSLLTPSSYVRGPGFVGVRDVLRRVLDELWIIDLEGDRLAARKTDNVFPIRTPVAIAMGVRYTECGQNDHPAVVHYTRLAGNRDEKLASLDRVHRPDDLRWQVVDGRWSAPFVPRRATDYGRWPKLTDLFPWQVSGAQLKRTWPIAPTPEVLRERWARLLELSGAARAAAFRETRDRDLNSVPLDVVEPTQRLPPLGALARDAACGEPVRYAYRSFDRQWVLRDARLGDFMRPVLWRVVGPRQIFVTSLLTNVLGPGPAAVATALVPDLDHFRGSFGGRAVIPLWCDAAASEPNVRKGLLERLGDAYGQLVTPERLLAYCYALLSTPRYVARFSEELRTPGPRVPLTRDGDLFRRVVALGQLLLWLHTFGQRCAPPGEPADSVPTGRARCLTAVGTEYPGRYAYASEEQVLRVGDGTFGPVAPEVWAVSVSGLAVVASWLKYRVSKPSRRASSTLDEVRPRVWTSTLTHELLELLWVLEETLALEPRLNAMLETVVSGGGWYPGASGVAE